MRGRVLRVKTGFNPNSSSIGTNLTPLIVGGVLAALAVPVISFVVARWLRSKRERTETGVPPPGEHESSGQ